MCLTNQCVLVASSNYFWFTYYALVDKALIMLREPQLANLVRELYKVLMQWLLHVICDNDNIFGFH
jgi:hypothetical protein